MRTFTPTSLARELEQVLGKRLPLVQVEAEVAQIHEPSSGHCYLQLRDRDATLSCVMWRSAWRGQRFRPEPGDRVVCRGRVGVFGGQSRYQLYVNIIEPAGVGKLARELQARRARLEAEGLLDPRRKRSLPVCPRWVGVATSITGAALQDFLRVSRHRYPAARVLVAGCTVQGERAAPSVLRAVELLLEDGRAEVIVVTRGGGSKMDLLPFWDEQLARFLAHVPVPVVSAVGHEIDTTLADLVADAVAPTPTAAAVQILPDGPALAQRVDQAEHLLCGAVHRLLGQARRRVAELAARNRDPRQRLAGVRSARADLLVRLHAATLRHVESKRREILAARARLDAVSPTAVLERGFAVVVGPTGVVTSVQETTAGDALRIHLIDGRLSASVTGVEE